ncbi:MAG: hypothetical protein ACK4ND_11065 [Cytophagaceae bacterium]
MNTFKLIIFYHLLSIFLLSCEINKKVDFPYVEERNQGLVGDKITSLEVSPADSGTWVLNGLKRVYITNNYGKNWRQLEQPFGEFMGYFSFSKNGDLVYFEGGKIAIQDNDGKFIPQPLPSGDNVDHFYRDSNNVLNVIVKTQEKKFFIRTVENLTYNINQITEDEYSGLIHQVWFEREVKAADSTFVDFAGGHILLYTDSTTNPVKRMNGINRPGIEGLLQSEKSPDIVFAIQRGRYALNTLFNMYYLYKSEDFGRSWVCIDSSESWFVFRERNQLKYSYAQKFLFREKERRGFYTLDKIFVNDSLNLSMDEGLVLENIKDSSTIVIIPTDYPNYYYDFPNIKGPTGLPLYLPKIENDTLKLLVASLDGGILFFKKSLRGQ